MEFYDVINKRRSIRQFQDKPIPQETLERILDAGLKAPSSNHQRQWELVTITDKEMITKVANIVKPYPSRNKEPKTPQQEMFKISFSRQHSMVQEAACVVMPYIKMKYDLKSPKNDWGLWDYGASWTVSENILLAATNEGVATAIHIPVKKEPEQLKALVGAKDGYFLPTLLLLGYASEDAVTPTQVEASVQKNVHWNKW